MADGTAEEPPFDVDVVLAARLVADQFPDFAGVELGRRYRVEDHVAVRLGDQHGVWLPLDSRSAATIAGPAALAKTESEHWHFHASVQVAVGEPTDYYPYPWQIVSWRGSSTAALVPLTASAAAPLGAALAEIHRDAPDAPESTANQRLEDTTTELVHLLEAAAGVEGPQGEHINPEVFRRYWQAGVDAGVDVKPTWVHGSLRPINVLSSYGDFDGICNWQHFGAGDPAVDLGAMKSLLPADAEAAAWEAYGEVSEATRARAFAFCKLITLRNVTSGNPFLINAAWATIGNDPELIG